MEKRTLTAETPEQYMYTPVNSSRLIFSFSHFNLLLRLAALLFVDGKIDWVYPLAPFTYRLSIKPFKWAIIGLRVRTYTILVEKYVASSSVKLLLWNAEHTFRSSWVILFSSERLPWTSLFSSLRLETAFYENLVAAFWSCIGPQKLRSHCKNAWQHKLPLSHQTQPFFRPLCKFFANFVKELEFGSDHYIEVGVL